MKENPMSADLASNPGSSLPVSHPAVQPAGLSQVERVVDVFVAPSKTFTDILRSTSWWLPFVLMLVFSYASNYVIDKQVGFDRVYENQLQHSPKAEDQLNQLTPEQRAQRVSIGVKITKYTTYAIPPLLVIGFAFYALVLWGAFNFGLGAKTTFGQVFATCFYASLPYLLLNLLTIVMLYFGANAEAFDIKNPVGTNPAYYLPDASPVVRALLNRLDIIQLWTLGLTVLGMAIVARKTIMQSAILVVGWWFVVTLVSVGFAAAS
jgi:hypothetical protein